MKNLSKKIVLAGLACLFAVVLFACGGESSSSVSVNSSEIEGGDNSSSSLDDTEKLTEGNEKTTSSSSSKKEEAKSGSSSKSKSSASGIKENDKGYADEFTDNGYDDDDDEKKEPDSNMSSSSNQSETTSNGCPVGEERVYLINDVYVTKKCIEGKWEVLSSSSEFVPYSSFNMDIQYNPDMLYGKSGVFKDERDGREYHIVTIWYSEIGTSDTMTVFAENLNYGTQVMSGTKKFNDNKVEKFCYNDDPLNCDNGYGGLYTWAEAMNLPQACNNELTESSVSCPNKLVDNENMWKQLEHQGICPDGWHIMNVADYEFIYNTREGGPMRSAYSVLSSAISEEYDNEYGLSYLYTGSYDYSEGVYKEAFVNLAQWISQEQDANHAKIFYILDGYNDISPTGDTKSNGLSVRCVKNRTNYREF